MRHVLLRLTTFTIGYHSCDKLSAFVVRKPKRVAETVWSDECSNWEHLNGLKISKIILKNYNK